MPPYSSYLLVAVCLLASWPDIANALYVHNFVCDRGPYRLTLPNTYRGLRGIGIVKQDQLVRTTGVSPYELEHRKVVFNGLELAIINPASDRSKFMFDKVETTNRRWIISKSVRVGDPIAPLVSKLGLSDDPGSAKGVQIEGDLDKLAVAAVDGRIVKITYLCFRR